VGPTAGRDVSEYRQLCCPVGHQPLFYPSHSLCTILTELPWLTPSTSKAGDTLYSRHVSSHKTYVLFSTPSLPMHWLSYADLCNLVTWCHIKRSVGALFNKHFLQFWKQLVTSEERSTRTSRLTKCVRQRKFERRAGT